MVPRRTYQRFYQFTIPSKSSNPNYFDITCAENVNYLFSFHGTNLNDIGLILFSSGGGIIKDIIPVNNITTTIVSSNIIRFTSNNSNSHTCRAMMFLGANGYINPYL